MNIYLYFFFNEGLYRHNRGSNICYAYFFLVKAVPEDYLQNDDDISCVTGVTEITGPLFTTKYIRSDLLALFQHAVEEAET